MSAISTRAYLQQVGQYYLTPLSQIGETATGKIVYHVTPLNPVQQTILALLGFPPDLYTSLARTYPQNQHTAIL